MARRNGVNQGSDEAVPAVIDDVIEVAFDTHPAKLLANLYIRAFHLSVEAI